jgi:hypothetical protein
MHKCQLLGEFKMDGARQLTALDDLVDDKIGSSFAEISRFHIRCLKARYRDHKPGFTALHNVMPSIVLWRSEAPIGTAFPLKLSLMSSADSFSARAQKQALAWVVRRQIDYRSCPFDGSHEHGC